MAMPAGYKPSPLGYGSPRSSPFRRPESPVSPSPLRQTTPHASPFRGATTPVSTNATWTPRNQPGVSQLQPAAEISMNGSTLPPRPAASPSMSASSAPITTATTSAVTMAHGSALSQLRPAQVRMLRDGFQILDRDSDGSVGREDVADMLNQLGLPSTPSDVAQFFPPAAPQTITMGTFLNGLACALAALSDSSELLSALSAFDEDDNGEIDAAELREALLHTAPEPGQPPLSETDINRVMQGFMGRRVFKGKPGPGFGKRSDVFKYQDLVHSITGSGQGGASGDDDQMPRE